MEQKDLSLIEEMVADNPELAELWKEHIALEVQLKSLDERVYLTPEEQVERKRLQKIKLAGRDRIEAILAEHRGNTEQP